MSNEMLIALCTIGGTVGGALGAAIGFLTTVKVQLALHRAKFHEHGTWIQSLRKSRHRVNNLLQRQEIRLANVEHRTGVKSG